MNTVAVRQALALILALALAVPGMAYARDGSSEGPSSGGSHHPGKNKRSQKAKHAFKKSHPCPLTGKSSGACPGYVIDHAKPLKRGGADDPSNMQWQTREAAREKDRWE